MKIQIILLFQNALSLSISDQLQRYTDNLHNNKLDLQCQKNKHKLKKPCFENFDEIVHNIQPIAVIGSEQQFSCISYSNSKSTSEWKKYDYDFEQMYFTNEQPILLSSTNDRVGRITIEEEEIDNFKRQNLTIELVAEKNAGVYVCKVTNKFGSTSAFFLVNPKPIYEKVL